LCAWIKILKISMKDAYQGIFRTNPILKRRVRCQRVFGIIIDGLWVRWSNPSLIQIGYWLTRSYFYYFLLKKIELRTLLFCVHGMGASNYNFLEVISWLLFELMTSFNPILFVSLACLLFFSLCLLMYKL
jgi:hypothetical protein